MRWPLRSPWAVAALFAAALALYWSSLRHPLVFDDLRLTPAFLRSYGESWFKGDLRWLAYASFGWTHTIAGADLLWLRLGNVLLHGAVAATLYAFLARLFRHVLGTDGRGIAFLGALLFLVHPVAVYAVAYLMQRSILMATLFGLAALLLFLEALVRRSSVWYVASVAAYFAAVFSKEHSVMLPAAALALALLVRGASWKLARELALPMALYAGIAVLVTLKLKGLLGTPYEPFAADLLRQIEPEGAEGAARGPALHALSIANQALLFFRYLATWLLPYPGWMSIDLRPVFPASLASWTHLAGLAAWLAYPVAAAALLVRGGRRGLAGFALLAPWLLALPEMTTIRVQEPFVLYRSYLWMSLLPAALPALCARLRPGTVAALLGAACLALLPWFFDRLGTFRSDVAVWDDAVRKADPRSPYADRAYRNRGVAHYQAGRYREALQDFDQALELDPRNTQSWLNRGSLYMRLERSQQARADFDRVLALEPRHAEALARRCVVLMRLARLDEALADCEAALALGPDAADNHVSLGMVHALRGDTAQAERSYRRALELDPASAVARYQYGTLLRGLRRGDEARREFAAACDAGLRSACAAAQPR